EYGYKQVFPKSFAPNGGSSSDNKATSTPDKERRMKVVPGCLLRYATENSMNKGTLKRRRRQEDTYGNSYCIEPPDSFHVLRMECKVTVKECNS
uniref:Uncharacterized protein n=1 Tax=Cucumis melo TaxID=3656 RepID=A0A9I9DMA9_CUCME